MIGNILYALLFIGVAGFIDYRLWWSIQNRTIQIKGWIFKLDERPGFYCVHLILNLAAALMVSALAVVVTSAAITHS